MKVFIIPGYGIPESIEQDQNYLTYLHIAFNRIHEVAKGEGALIIPCGGPTNCTPPYQGTDSGIIADYIQKLVDRSVMGDRCAKWSVKVEDRSLSTLENLLFAKEIVDAEEAAESITIFCEATRCHRIRTVADVIFADQVLTVEPVDFDTSSNRYLASDIIQKREDAEIAGSLWALDNPDRLVGHHALFERRLALLRSLQDGGMSHVDAVTEWYRQAPALIAELMPDHPGVK